MPRPRAASIAQHTAEEYGATKGPDGSHSGGPFTIQVSPKMRIEELRRVIRVGCIQAAVCSLCRATLLLRAVAARIMARLS